MLATFMLKNTGLFDINNGVFTSDFRFFDSKNNYFFDFKRFEILGEEFIRDFGNNFIKISSCQTNTSAKSSYYTSLFFLNWLVENQIKFDAFIKGLRNDHKKVSPEDWENIIDFCRNDILSNSLTPIGKFKMMCALQTLIRKMCSLGVIPKLFLKTVPNHLKKQTRPIRTLAELPKKNLNDSSSELILEKILASNAFPDINIEEKKNFLKTLLDEEGIIEGSPKEIAHKLMKINSERLKKLRECAVKDFEYWYRHWLKGQELLQSCDMKFDDINKIVNLKCIQYEPNKELHTAMFPSHHPEITLSRVLKFFSEHPTYQGQLIKKSKSFLPFWVKRLIIKLGGEQEIQAYIFPHKQMTIAAITIFLCDTGSNISVGQTLAFDCLENSNDPRYKMIKGIKMRSSGKLIVNELPVRDPHHEKSCIYILETYQTISEKIRKLATTKIAKNLFLQIGFRGDIKPIGRNIWCRGFRKFINRHGELSNFHITAPMIRPSVLMQATYDKEAGIIAANAIGDHKLFATTDRYVGRFPNMLLWEKMVQKFQSLFQVVAIQNIKGVAKKLNLSLDQIKNLLSEAHRTGLGIACLNPFNGTQPESKIGETCNQIQNCPTCPNRFVIATVENLKDLILWNHHLKQLREEWEISRPQRWEKVWLPWLVFTEVAIEQARRGRNLIEFTRAKAIADEQIAMNEVKLGPLW